MNEDKRDSFLCDAGECCDLIGDDLICTFTQTDNVEREEQEGFAAVYNSADLDVQIVAYRFGRLAAESVAVEVEVRRVGYFEYTVGKSEFKHGYFSFLYIIHLSFASFIFLGGTP